MEAELIKTTTTLESIIENSAPAKKNTESDSSLTCAFAETRFYAEIRENTLGRNKLMQLKSNCSQNRVFYTLFKSTGNKFMKPFSLAA